MGTPCKAMVSRPAKASKLPWTWSSPWKCVRKPVSQIPELENADYIISIGSQPEFASPLDRALQIATSDMVDWLTKDYKMEPWAAHLLIGFQGKYDVITVAGSVGSAHSAKVAAVTLA